MPLIIVADTLQIVFEHAILMLSCFFFTGKNVHFVIMSIMIARNPILFQIRSKQFFLSSPAEDLNFGLNLTHRHVKHVSLHTAIDRLLFRIAVRRHLTIYTKLLSFVIDRIIIIHKVAIHFLVIRLELFPQKLLRISQLLNSSLVYNVYFPLVRYDVRRSGKKRNKKMIMTQSNKKKAMTHVDEK